MSQKEKELEYRTRQLERQVGGIQRHLKVMEARSEVSERRTDRRIRDLEIRDAVSSGVSQRKVAEIFDISAGRVNQIVRRKA